MESLVLAHVRNDPFDVGVIKIGDRCHVAKRPVVLLDTVYDSQSEHSITVMVRLVHNRQV